MCTETGIKDVYQGVQGACPRRAVTHAYGTVLAALGCSSSMGLKLSVWKSSLVWLIGPKRPNWDQDQDWSIFQLTKTKINKNQLVAVIFSYVTGYNR